MDFRFETYTKGDAGYEKARRQAVWNGRKPDRFPSIICLPETEEDVITAVKYANANDLKVGIRSGGHSWTASFLRDGGMLISLAKMCNVTFDARDGFNVAQVQPGVHGGDLNGILEPLGYMYPSGHCPTVAVGGFLLQGGFGWNSREWGPSCQSILACDIVTAEGKLVHASEKENSDLFWAVRGAGPGFFGIVTKFYLKLYPRPKAIMASIYFIPYEHIDDLMMQLEEIQGVSPRSLEVSLVVARDQGGIPGITAMIFAVCMAEEAQARSALQLLEDMAVVSHALMKMPFHQCTLKELSQRVMESQNVEGRHYIVDNVWTDRPVNEVLPSIHNIIDDIPQYPAHLYILYWGPVRTLPEMSFSMQGKLWLSYYATHEEADPAVDEKHADLVATKMGDMAHLGNGIQLADENLIGRPAKFMAFDNFFRLQALRKIYDPKNRFHSYTRLPKEFEDVVV